MSARIFVLGGRDAGRSFVVAERGVLGRAPQCDVRLADRSISRIHAKLERIGGRWFLEDQGSRNGIRRGEKRVRRVEVSDHDEFLLGELPLRIRLDDAASAVPDALPADLDLESEPPAVPGPAGEVELEGLEPGGPEEDEIVLEGVDDAPEDDGRAAYEARRRAVLAPRGRHGLLRGDLAQQPAWVRGVVTLFVLGVFAGLVYLAYRGVVQLRG